MKTVYNFGAGPAMLPPAVLAQAQAELCDWQGSGMSITEISHRSKAFEDLLEQAEQDLRDLLQIPKHYQILFLSGPARAQFAMIPMNLLRKRKIVDYLDTGIWSNLAAEEAKKYAKVNCVASSAPLYQSIPAFTTWQLTPDAAYFYYTANETINGIELLDLPSVGDVPIVSDMTSCLLMREIPINRFALIYAGCQKNIAPAGMTIVIVREDLVGETLLGTPTVFDYQVQIKNRSLYYTPATFSCYLAALNFQWLKQQGGIHAMEELNQRKSSKLYHYIDTSGFYYNHVDSRYRSMINIPFSLSDPKLNEIFLYEAELRGLKNLKGHRLVGGMRASLYNAMPEEGVDALIDFMQAFLQTYA